MKLSPKTQGIFFIIASLILLLASWQQKIPATPTEVIGFATGAATVWLQIKQNIWSWPLAIISSIFYMYVFFDARLYADMGLQVVYAILAVFGIYFWLRGGEDKKGVKVAGMTIKDIALYTAICAVLTYAMMLYLQKINGAAPFMDALTTSMSLVAQYLLTRKFIENWYVWIAADVIYVYLYITRELYLTAILYFIFLLMCIAGIRAWRLSHKAALDQGIVK
jgi:nicotinamide mononucleotide transporter